MGPTNMEAEVQQGQVARISQLLSAEPELGPRCSSPSSITQTHWRAEIIVKLQYMGTFFFFKASFTILKQFGLSV